MLQLALKNIFYYKGRSITTFVLTFLSTLFFILYVALMDGSHHAMLQNALKIYTGPIEIYKKGYRDIGGNDYLIEDVGLLESKLLHVKGIKSVTSRYETFGLLSNQTYSAAAMVVGIDPQKERVHSQIAQALQMGTYLDHGEESCLYMGSELAKKLHLSLQDDVAFIGSASDNSFAAELLKLCGTFKTGAYEFDATAAFIRRSYFDTIMLSHNKASYISIIPDALDQVDTLQKQIQNAIDSKDFEVLTWKTLLDTMVEAMEVDSIFGYISLSLFMVVIFFVIMIYGFINVSARVREFGVLRCIGMNDTKIWKLLFYEIALLTLGAIALAAPLASGLCYYFHVHPIVIEGIAEMYKDYGIVSDEMPLDFNLFSIGWNVGMIVLLNGLSIFYPYMYIRAQTPIEASRHV